MAYDPKSYLNQALQQGFESVYSQPASFETGEAPQYQGDVATFGDVQVRTLTEPIYEGTGDAAYQVGTTPSGHMVSVPLTGQYQGYFRNDIYDNDGNFVRTAISEPADSGFKDLAQIGLMALSGGILGPTGQLFSKGVGAIGALQSGDPLRILGAISGLPGAGDYIPAELSTLAKYAGQAGQIKSALSGDPSAIFRLVSGADKSGALPKGLAGDIDLSGADAIEGFFAPGGEGYVEPGSFAQSPDEAYEDIESLLARYENQGFADAPTGDLSQSIDITGRRETDIPDWDILPDVYTPRSIRDIGNVTQVQPGEQLEGTEIKEPDLTTGLTPAVTAPAPKPATPGKAPTPSPAPKAAKPGMDIGALFALLGAMGGQQPTQAPAPYQTARINTESPFGLMYGLES